MLYHCPRARRARAGQDGRSLDDSDPQRAGNRPDPRGEPDRGGRARHAVGHGAPRCRHDRARPRGGGPYPGARREAGLQGLPGLPRDPVRVGGRGGGARDPRKTGPARGRAGQHRLRRALPRVLRRRGGHPALRRGGRGPAWPDAGDQPGAGAGGGGGSGGQFPARRGPGGRGRVPPRRLRDRARLCRPRHRHGDARGAADFEF